MQLSNISKHYYDFHIVLFFLNLIVIKVLILFNTKSIQFLCANQNQQFLHVYANHIFLFERIVSFSNLMIIKVYFETWIWLMWHSISYLFIPKSYSKQISCVLTWFIRYIYNWNLQFLNNVIINKSKVLLPQLR